MQLPTNRTSIADGGSVNIDNLTDVDDPHIECRDLFKIYKRAELEVVALRGVDLDVHVGEMIAIVGASGSGKSTLLNILSGLDRPSAGQVRVGKRDLLDISDRDLVLYRRSDVGFVWQATARNLVPYLNVQDNIELPMAITGMDAGRRRDWSIELLDALSISDKSSRFAHQLSGGEQQRVAIAVAMANKPPLLLADEPTGNLDSHSSVEIIAILQKLNHEEGITVVLVTHEPDIAAYTNRIVSMLDGVVVNDHIVDKPSIAIPSGFGKGE